ncbi:MAG: hypothetical protein IH987_02045 [Planctomycetes bacterium]|nr:hypothetical protein [Planctomycetota bacterium]
MTMLTVGDVARRLKISRARVAYAVEKFGVQERTRAGILRLFSEDQLPVIEAAIRTVRHRQRSTIEAKHGD